VEKAKKKYYKAELAILGDLASITQNVIAPGSGDLIALSQGIPDVLAS
jgi:hypothetical protein